MFIRPLGDSIGPVPGRGERERERQRQRQRASQRERERETERQTDRETVCGYTESDIECDVLLRPCRAADGSAGAVTGVRLPRIHRAFVWRQADARRSHASDNASDHHAGPVFLFWGNRSSRGSNQDQTNMWQRARVPLSCERRGRCLTAEEPGLLLRLLQRAATEPRHGAG